MDQILKSYLVSWKAKQHKLSTLPHSLNEQMMATKLHFFCSPSQKSESEFSSCFPQPSISRQNYIFSLITQFTEFIIDSQQLNIFLFMCFATHEFCHPYFHIIIPWSISISATLFARFSSSSANSSRSQPAQKLPP